MSNSRFILTASGIHHHIPLFDLLLFIIGYLHLIVSLSLPFTLTLLIFNLTTFLRSRSSYRLKVRVLKLYT
ncbi:transmembrane protein, putative [Medicago truncatula]|uniref:Transmembrane protein, putative n=1 Tax=Medicago truncatula TaxID=3880 RepID=G7KCJ5_MEDTR|nr:transmembrane protein, putative [Medicago truncatula]